MNRPIGPVPDTGVEVTTLPGGLRVVTDAMPHLATASLGVWTGAGARSEAEGEHGLAHLLEHMAFKGTRRRSAQAIAEEIENVGGDLNAATSVEQTAYYARVLKEDVPLGLDILADILTQSTFEEAELERERGVILQEIGAVEDTPDDLVFDLFSESAFPDQPLGRRILGTPDTVRSLGRPAIEGYLATHYRAPGMVVSAAGAVEHARVVDEAARLFERLPAGPAPAPPPAAYVGGETVVESDHEQATIVLGFEGLPYGSPDLQALGVFTGLLGGGMSSRLFQEVRERRGLCYSVYAFHWSYAETGLFGISAGAGGEDLAELMPVILDTALRATTSVTAQEVARAKAQAKAGLLMSLESSPARAEQMARHLLLYGRVLPPEEIVARIEAVTEADVARVGARVLATAPTLAALGPVATLPRGDRLAALLVP